MCQSALSLRDKGTHWQVCGTGHRVSALVLERQQDARAILLHLAVLNLHVHLYDLGNAQVPQGLCGGLYRILRCIFPRPGAVADDLHQFVNAFGSCRFLSDNASYFSTEQKPVRCNHPSGISICPSDYELWAHWPGKATVPPIEWARFPPVSAEKRGAGPARSYPSTSLR